MKALHMEILLCYCHATVIEHTCLFKHYKAKLCKNNIVLYVRILSFI